MEDDLLNLTLDDGPEPTNTHSESNAASASRTGSRDYQSEADFQAVKAAYRPKIENGEVGNIAISQQPQPHQDTIFLFAAHCTESRAALSHP